MRRSATRTRSVRAPGRPPRSLVSLHRSSAERRPAPISATPSQCHPSLFLRFQQVPVAARGVRLGVMGVNDPAGHLPGLNLKKLKPGQNPLFAEVCTKGRRWNEPLASFCFALRSEGGPLTHGAAGQTITPLFLRLPVMIYEAMGCPLASCL